jgi:hypothetical protein
VHVCAIMAIIMIIKTKNSKKIIGFSNF